MEKETLRIFAGALRQVIGRRMRQSQMYVWRDERTWNDLAQELIAMFDQKFVVVEKSDYAKIKADAAKMAEVRKRFQDYEDSKKTMKESKK